MYLDVPHSVYGTAILYGQKMDKFGGLKMREKYQTKLLTENVILTNIRFLNHEFESLVSTSIMSDCNTNVNLYNAIHNVSLESLEKIQSVQFTFGTASLQNLINKKNQALSLMDFTCARSLLNEFEDTYKHIYGILQSIKEVVKRRLEDAPGELDYKYAKMLAYSYMLYSIISSFEKLIKLLKMPMDIFPLIQEYSKIYEAGKYISIGIQDKMLLDEPTQDFEYLEYNDVSVLEIRNSFIAVYFNDEIIANLFEQYYQYFGPRMFESVDNAKRFVDDKI